ncbi:type IA DNA topoisomerase [Mesoplasma coleopterae]|uniref:DNA topoisomerase 1 n=1 Tax=Mesoplasma coleopterae TaxID=324078 RepID=A0A2K8P4W0_9MOLU|nr:type IA DNA topoisomerase [Mesoplasma coleopterae]ATZ21180.1 DNA topoisomerase I [Mesoplasma coleopterae]
MTKYLVLLESPSKVDKIKHYLTKNFPEDSFEVLASGGHINKIADSGPWGLGIDLQTMTPTFKIETTKRKNVSEITKAGKNADKIILASDPDREGEAIAWHLANLFTKDNKEIKRITFNEITESAVVKAFGEMREIDLDLVNAQLSRQMLDKIIGYMVSNSLQKSTGLLSAGRVQTPALKILVDRDKIIKAFVETIYKKIFVVDQKQNVKLFLYKDDNNLVVNDPKNYYISEEQSKVIKNNLGVEYKCTKYKAKEFEVRSFKPYSTASLLQDGFSKLRMSAAQITVAAQKLYEAGLVTYIRTDSNRYSSDFVVEAKNFINKNFKGDLFKEAVTIKIQANAQEAHESIRPTDLNQRPENISSQIEDKNMIRLYNLIWWNTVKSLMKGPSGFYHNWTFWNNGYEFKQSWKEVLDLGYNKLDKSETDEDIELDENDDEILNDDEVKPPFEFKENYVFTIGKEAIVTEDAKTSPPRMFNQASLVRELKDLGIGRPSTYTPTLSKLKEREYAIPHRGKPFEVTEKGYQAEEFLYEKYEDFFNVNYTAKMEQNLDKIAEGNFDHKDWIKSIYEELSESVKAQIQEAKTSDIKCPRCHEGSLVFIKSKFGRGRGCSNFTTTKCGYREYEQKDGSWLEYVAKPKEEKEKAKD